jgi:hypothetical protein
MSIEHEEKRHDECACKQKISKDGHQALPRNGPRASAQAGRNVTARHAMCQSTAWTTMRVSGSTSITRLPE